jgi:hypothetical protein
VSAVGLHNRNWVDNCAMNWAIVAVLLIAVCDFLFLFLTSRRGALRHFSSINKSRFPFPT